MQWLIDKAPALASVRNSRDELPIDLLMKSDKKADIAYDLLKLAPNCNLRVQTFVDLLLGNMLSEEKAEEIKEFFIENFNSLYKNILNSYSVGYCISELVTVLTESKVLKEKKNIKQLVKVLNRIGTFEFSRKFIKRLSKDSSGILTNKDYLAFLEEKIPDVDLKKLDPYQKIKAAFKGLDEKVYRAHLNTGEKKENWVSIKEAKEKKTQETELLYSLLDAIKTRKKDDAIPKGEEELHYKHLEKILKHFAQDIQEGKYKSFAKLYEQFFFLLDGAQVCYTVYSTRIRQLYVNRSQDSVFSQTVAKQDSEKKGFEEFLYKDFNENLKVAISGLFNNYYNGVSGEDAHLSSLLEYFLRKEGLPTLNRETYDGYGQLHVALYHVARHLDIAVQGLTTTEEEFNGLYEKTTDHLKFFLALKILYLSDGSLLKKLSDHLNQKDTKKANSFLTDLTEWFSLHGLNAVDLMEYDDSYKLERILPEEVIIAFANAKSD